MTRAAVPVSESPAVAAAQTAGIVARSDSRDG